MDKQGPTVQHRKLYSTSCNKPVEKNMKKTVYICITESLSCTAKMNTIL